MIDRKQFRVISIDPDLAAGESPGMGLLWSLERGLHRAATDQGIEYLILAGFDAEIPPDLPVPVVRTQFVNTYFSMAATHWPALWRGRESRDFCDSILGALEQIPHSDSARTAYFLYHGHPIHIAALIRLGLAMRGVCPIVLNLYHLHAFYGLHRPARAPWLRSMLAATRELRRAANLHLRVDSFRLAEMIRRDTGEDIPVLPLFSPIEDEIKVDARLEGAAPLRLVYPTAMPSRDKGLDLVFALAEKLGRSDVEIVVRDTGGYSSEVCLPTESARRRGLRIIPSFLPNSGYLDLLAVSDLVLIPYASWQFLSRTSGVVADAIRLGKPMVGTANTWIGDQIQALNAGTTFRDGDSEDFVRAVQIALDHLDIFRRNLLDRREGWMRENNRVAFLKAVIGADTSNRKALGSFRRDACIYRLAAVTHGHIPFQSSVVDPLRLAIHRVSQRLRGRTGSLELVMDSEFSSVPAIVWRTQGVKQVELRLDAHDGFLIANGGGASGMVSLTWWIKNGQQVYLQDVSDGRPLLPQHTLGRLVFQRSTEIVRRRLAQRLMALRFVVRPAHRFLGIGTGNLKVTTTQMRRESRVPAVVWWDCKGVSEVEVFFDGKLFARGAGSGTAEAGPWVTEGATFALYDGSRSYLPMPLRLLDAMKVTVKLPRKPVTLAGHAWTALVHALGGFIRRFKNISPILTRTRTDRALLVALPALRWVRRIFRARTGQLTVTTPETAQEALVSATVAWTCPAEEEVEVRVGGLRGNLFARQKGPGTSLTGCWVQAGTPFLLLSAIPAHRSRFPIFRLLDVFVVPTMRQANSTVTSLPGQVRQAPRPSLSSSREHSLSKAVSPKEWGVVPPHASGEVYLLAAHARAFLDAHGGERLVILAPPNLLDLLRLFPNAPVRGADQREFQIQELDTRRQIGRVIKLDYGIANSFGRYSGVRTGFAHLFLQEAGLVVDANKFRPVVTAPLREAALRRLSELQLPVGRTVLISPTAKTQLPPPVSVWQNIVDALLRRGFSIATSCGPGESALPGTVAWTGSLSELYATVEIGGYFLSARNGLCDLCCTANTALHILHREGALVPWPGITILPRLTDNGLPDSAVYHQMLLGDAASEFAERVLAHPDFGPVKKSRVLERSEW